MVIIPPWSVPWRQRPLVLRDHATSRDPVVNLLGSQRVASGPSSAGNTRGLIEARRGRRRRSAARSLPRGIPAASLKHLHGLRYHIRRRVSSAGNTRGLIEADGRELVAVADLPSSAGNTRGLIEARSTGSAPRTSGRSSAGNTRGLIEACGPGGETGRRIRASSAGNTRGLIEAWGPLFRSAWQGGCLPRGIPAASLKPDGDQVVLAGCGRVFRGEYPRPH